MTGKRTKTGQWVAIYRAQDEWTAQMVRSWLIEDGIPAMVQSSMVVGYGSMMSAQTGGWGVVLVPESCREEADEVLADMLAEPNG